MNHRILSILILLAMAIFPLATLAQSAGHWSLDAVLDTRMQHSEGVPVLAVTPGGAAERIGLVAGDRILAINGAVIADSRSPQRVIDTALLDSNGHVVVRAARAGREMTLQGALGSLGTVDSVAGCGYVTDTDPTPVVSALVFPVEITQIDGNSTPLDPQNRFRLQAGQHVIVVRERIPLHRFNHTQLRDRWLMLRRLQARAYKAMVVDVAPGMRHQIGARLLTDRMDGDGIRDNAYWEPVIHGSRAETCR